MLMKMYTYKLQLILTLQNSYIHNFTIKAYKISARKPKWKRPLRRPRHRWKDKY